MNVRPASTADMRAIERVLGADRAAFYRLRLDRKGVVLTAWAGADPVGAVYVTWEPADEEVVRRHLPDVPFLHRLYVLPPLRNEGRGTALLGAAEALAEVRAAGRLAAGIDPRNVRVVGLYERLGYREWPHGLVETVQERYARDGEVATEPDVCRIFVKDLDPT